MEKARFQFLPAEKTNYESPVLPRAGLSALQAGNRTGNSLPVSRTRNRSCPAEQLSRKGSRGTYRQRLYEGLSCRKSPGRITGKFTPLCGAFTIGSALDLKYLCAAENYHFTMPNFTRQFPVEGTILDFRFSLIHYPGGVRYWVAVTSGQAYVASFYFEKNNQGAWKLSDRYKTAPAWAHTLESQLAAAIHSHKIPGEN